jgi:hypothetical protein
LEVPTALDILDVEVEEVEMAVVLDCLIADVFVPLIEEEMVGKGKCQNTNICMYHRFFSVELYGVYSTLSILDEPY